MENEFKKVMSQQTDEELINIITNERDSYNAMAIEAAEFEIEKRKIDTIKFNEIREKVSIAKETKGKVDSNVVSSGIRFVNFLIDFIVWLVLALITSFLITLFIQPTEFGLIQLLAYSLIFGTFIAYYAILEIKFQKTVGKFITKTKVVKLNGEIPETSDIIARTFCRLIPFDQISYLFTKNGFHDLLSKTTVVKDNEE